MAAVFHSERAATRMKYATRSALLKKKINPVVYAFLNTESKPL